MRRMLLVPVALFAIILGACRLPAKQDSIRVLFVGNSLTYVDNLPAVLEALAAKNGKSIHTEMIIKGGATLTERVHDGSIQHALDANRYDVVVLQERGGDYMCGFGPQSCRDANSSLLKIARIVSASHVKPILLGTYQGLPEASTAIVKAESTAAKHAAMPYVSVSDRLHLGLKTYPNAQWFYTDGMHPGHDLVLLESVLLYKHVFGELPAARTLTINAPMFVPGSKFSAPLPTCVALSNSPVSGLRYTYSQQSVADVIRVSQTR